MSVSLHPQSGNNTGCNGSEKVLNNVNNNAVEKLFKKMFQKIWWIGKFALPLHHFPLRNNEGGILKTVL